MTKNVKSIFLVATLLFLLVGVSAISASEVSDDATIISDIDDTTAPETVTTTPEKIADTPAKNIKTEETTTDYYVSDTSGSDDNSGTTESPYKTIQKALDQTTNENTYNIHILDGNYTGTGNTNLTVNGNYNINIIGNGLNNTIIDGQAKFDVVTQGFYWDSSETWFYYDNETGNWFMNITDGTGKITLNNMTVSHMYSKGAPGVNWNGDSIDLYPVANVDNYGNLEVNNVQFYENYGGVGSAIRNNNGGTLVVNNSYFEENRKSSSSGNEGIIYNNGTATIANTLFNHNYARWGTILNDKKITVLNSTLKNGIGYDGKSTYKYGSGFAYNSGGSDWYNQGYFETDNEVINCTFINNEQSDIYGLVGSITVNNNKFINSSGIYLTDASTNENITYTVTNNNMTNSIESSISSSLSSGNNIFSIYANIANNNLIIENNNITINNNASYTLYITSNNAVIKDNYINTTSDYAVTLTSRSGRNIIKDNILDAYNYKGNDAVTTNSKNDTVENNTPSMPEALFVGSNATTSAIGTIDEPTTIEDALQRVENNGIIYLVSNKNEKFSLTDQIKINNESVKENTDTFTICGWNPYITLQSENGIFNISQNYTVNLINLNFKNSTSDMGAVIYTEGNVNIENSTFTNSSAVYGAAIFANNNANVTLKNNLFKDITADYETIYLNNTGISSLENNKYVNTSILMDITITPDKTESIHVNDTVNIEIATPSLANPNYYDENIVDDLTYYVYVNDELVKQTKDISYSIKINDFNNVTTYVLSDIGKTRSNLVKIEVEYDKIIDVELSTPDVVTRLGTTANFETTIQDEFGLNLTCGTLSYYNGENLIAQQNVNNKNRITQRTPDLSAGTYTITINYTDDTNKYQNKSITTTLTILDTLYASPDVTTSNDGTPDNPTTVEDAFSKVNNNMKIVLLKGTRGVYTLNKTLILNKNNVEIIGVDAILDGGNNVRILQPSGTNLRITNLTFINGKDTTTNGGGAIYTGSALTLTNVNFYNNTATRGGAISASNITLTGTNSFIDNKATSDGGALYVTGVVTSMPRPPFQVKNPGTLTVSGENTFINNTANNGGSIYHNLGTLSVINATFENSNAKEGGAIYSTASGYTVEIKNNKFINCSSNKDTLYIVNTLNTIQNNTYQNCSIVNTFTLTSDLDNQTIDMNTPVTVNMNLTIRNPSYYDANILDNNEYTIVINDENRYTTTESAYTFTPEEYGTLNIYTTTPILKTQTNNITIEVIKKEITVDPITAAAGETINITAKITVNDEIMTDLSKGKVSFKVNGKTLKDTNGKVIYVKVVNGTATIEDYLVPDTWKEGTTIEAVYSGSTQCDKLTSEKTEITIEKATPTLTTSDVTAAAGETITLTATITDNDKVINNGKIVFKINGKTVKDANGKVIYAKVVNNQVSVEYTLPADMKAKDYNITATFISSDYERIEDTKTLTVTA